MTSLTDVYDGGVGTATGLRRRLLGAGLFALGAGMVVGAIPVATTDLAGELGLGVYEARELAGVLAGLGLPAVFVGILVVLPAGRVTRAAAAIGASVAVLGVALFAAAYPYEWISNQPTLAVVTTAIYSVGTLVTFWCLFVGLALFKRRNEPGGTARVEVTDEGRIRIVTEDGQQAPAEGSVGMVGSEPEGDVDTQTNRSGEHPETRVSLEQDDATIIDDAPSDTGQERPDRPTPAGDGAGGVQSAPTTDSTAGDGASSVQSAPATDSTAGDGASGVQSAPATDSPATVTDPAAAEADVRAAVDRRGQPDEYCGNCQHFEYVRADGEMVPYCGFHDGLLRDMDACDQWESNS
jgi:hypothetical protein